jgi:hypothetical protein
MKFRILAAALAMLSAVACGDAPGAPGPLSPAGAPARSAGVVARVEVTPNPVSVSVGQTAQLTARAYDAGGVQLAGKTATWSSSTPSVASVSASGVVTGNAGGSATIYAGIDGVYGSTPVAVRTPLTVSMTGPQTVQQNYGAYCDWYASVSGGTPPYSYTWYREGQLVGTEAGYYANYMYYTFPLEVRVTDAVGATKSVSRYVYVSSSYYACGY